MTRTIRSARGGCAALAILALLSAPLAADELRGKDRGPIEGLLLAAESGEPLAGAEVSVEPLPSRPGPASRDLERSTGEPAVRGKSDASGAYSLEAPAEGPLRIVIRAPGRIPLAHPLLPGAASFHLAPVALPAARSLPLRVVTESGEPVAGAAVTLLPSVDAPPWRRTREWGWQPLKRHGTTDDDGRLSLPVAEGEELWIEATTPGFLPGRPLHVPPEATAASRSEPAPLRVTLATAPTDDRKRASAAGGKLEDRTKPHGPKRLEGRLVGPDGGAVHGFVWADPDPGAAVATDATGRFHLPIPSGARWIVAASDGRRSRVTPVSELDPRRGPVELLLEPAAELSGRVVDPAGRPIPWAKLEAILPKAELGSAIPERLIVERPPVTWSGVDGRFRLGGLPALDGYKLAVERRGFHDRLVERSRGRAGDLTGELTGELAGHLEIVLEPDRIAFGAVLGPDELPVSGATVLLEPRGEPSGRRARRTLTLDDGSFEIADVEAGRWDLVASHPEHATSRVPGLVVPRRPGPVDLGTVVLGPQAVLSGLVTDPRGQPVGGATVRTAGVAEDLPGDRRSVVTDAAGGFELRGLSPGTSVDLRVEHPDHVTARLDGVPLPAPEPLTIVLEDGLRLSGRVVDEDGLPVARARVRLDPITGQGPPPGGISGDDGRFVLDGVRAGTYGALARAPGYLDSERLEVEIGEGAPPVELVLRHGARILGRVLAPDGLPAADATVRVVGAGTTPGIGQPPAHSDPTGRYRLDGVAPGRRLLEARHPRYPPHRQEVEVAPGENHLDLVFEPGSEVSGRVIDPSGTPVSGATVELSGDGPPTTSGSTRADGGFDLGGVAPGLYRLHVRHAGYAPARVEGIEVGPAGVSGLEVVLEPGAVIAGRVLGLALDDLGRLEVSASDTRSHLLRGAVDYSGSYRVTGVPPGEWWLIGELPDGRTAEAGVTVSPGDREVAADLEFRPERELRGRVLLAGEPLADAEVTLARHGSRPRATAFTDYDGRFVLTDAPADGGLLRVVQPGRGVSHEQELAPGTEHVVVDLRGTSLSGTVRSASGGAPLDGAVVTVERSEAPEPVRRHTRTGPDGRFRLPDLQTGRWQVSARAEGFAPAETVVELSPAGGATSLTLELEPTSGLEIGLLLPSGGTPATVHAALVSTGGHPVLGGTYPADDRGRVHLDAPAGSWRLLVASPGTATLETPVTAPGVEGPFQLPAGGTLEVELLGLSRPDLLVRLRVEGPDGRPIPVVGIGGRLATEHAVVRGHARIDGLPAGDCVVRATAEDGSRWEGQTAVVPGAVTPLVLAPAGAPP